MSNQLIELLSCSTLPITLPSPGKPSRQAHPWRTRAQQLAHPPGHPGAAINWRGLSFPGQPVIRYGQVIGFASRDIQPGDWVHSHNLEVGDMRREFDVQVAPLIPPAPLLSPKTGEGG